ncbi:MAG: glutamate synthase large subunit [Kiritimatiellia bacterium]|nr:glutamate synthase large subunit [Kiritimatiellia bacterium]
MKPYGLYNPTFEHDACGVGMLCNIKGVASHAIVSDALKILANLNHRGATGYDSKTGDGAGILIQLPHQYFAAIVPNLPPPKDYAVGMIQFPQAEDDRRQCEQIIEDELARHGFQIILWRDVPIEVSAIGELAQSTLPRFRQLFVSRNGVPLDAFERKLFITRKLIEHRVWALTLPEGERFYIPSLSSRTINYKGLMLSDAIDAFYPELKDERVQSALALVHQRYSTNTFPSWRLAQPFRFISHNGEINTLRGNQNWMSAREGLFSTPLLDDEMKSIFPILTEGDSDSAILDNAIEFFYHAGRSLPHVMMMLIPEAWQHYPEMPQEKRDFYEYHACMMEPWDGPASIPFTDGEIVGAVLDRNGLRPSRYTVTKDDRLIMSSETGVLPVAPENVAYKGRLQPGRMLLVDTKAGRIIGDDEIKMALATAKPYGAWLKDNLKTLSVPDTIDPGEEPDERLYHSFGYTQEDLKIILAPMAQKGMEATGSMGTDTPLAVMSKRPKLLYDYFHQLFAQVTNPPLDGIREEMVTSLDSYLGVQGNILEDGPQRCRMLKLRQPVLTEAALNAIPDQVVLDITFDAGKSPNALEDALKQLCKAAINAAQTHHHCVTLSDSAVSETRAPIPALLAVSATHHSLVKAGLRTAIALVLDSCEPREVHHFACLLGYGVDAICPRLALAAVRRLARLQLYVTVSEQEAVAHFIKAVGKGLLKVMSKVGISTLQSYRGAQIFEAVGISGQVIDNYFPGTISRVGGVSCADIQSEVETRFLKAQHSTSPLLELGGNYQWRQDGEKHLYNPQTIALLQQACRENNETLFEQYVERLTGEQAEFASIRGLMDFVPRAPIPLEEVEPWTEIVKRFKTGAMSYGSISRPAHETLAIAMNRIGGCSNSGEGGEDPDRFLPDAKGNWRISQIKQVASGRFGVTSNYLAHAKELQIKMAQGAKPGEGGQLPAEKVYPWIAKCRHSTPYVQLISPPPHHDIYSIEDLAQLIHDLKNSNPEARVSVKLVSKTGIGTIAAGVAKGKADLILVSGYDGGTGASPLTSIKHTGLPWEIGLAEVQQTLVLNKLRNRVRLECDGKLMTGRDVAIACLLGAEEFGFATAPLVAIGCVMMRVCHLNTCPQGIATQDPRLSCRFKGKPEYVVNFMRFIAEDLRKWMARLGFRTIDEMVGHVECLKPRQLPGCKKAQHIDLSAILAKVPCSDSERHCSVKQDHGVDMVLDRQLIAKCERALELAEPIVLDISVRNTQRTVGTMLSYEISRRTGEEGLPNDTIRLNATGSCGQSFAAFGAKGLTISVEGDANDYFGKGLSGAKLALYPPRQSTIVPDRNIICGNVALYGATSGEVYICGVAGERFAVRNSGATAVVEGVGDHGCEYMTGGRVLVLGTTGRNFAAGMSGGIAYVLDETGDFEDHRCNTELVDLEPLADSEEAEEVRKMILRHRDATGSKKAATLLADWTQTRHRIIKIMPRDYKRALAMQQQNAE